MWQEDAKTRRGLMFVLSSPSGAGKTTIARKLLDQHSDLTLSVSATTRPMRPGEIDGKDYDFISEKTFDEMINSNRFLEWARVFEQYYGTPKARVDDALEKGRDVLFDVDWQGAKALKAVRPDDVVSVFILPPSIPALESRLRGRAGASEEQIRKRLEGAKGDITNFKLYDYVVVNDDLDQTGATINSILISERQKRHRQKGLARALETYLERG